MCTPLLAQVVALQADTALVTSNDQLTTVSCRGLPVVQPGDWVLVYLGHIVERVLPQEVEALEELLRLVNDPEHGAVAGVRATAR